MKPILGILLGESAGIGPEIVAKLCAEEKISVYCRPVLIGDARVLYIGKKIIRKDFSVNVIENISQIEWEGPISILDQKNLDPSKIELGKINADSGRVTGEMFETALSLVKEKKIEGFVFAPYNKAALEYGGYNFFKIFPRYLKIKWPFGEMSVVNNIWISRVTSHIPLKDVSKRLNVRIIIGAIKLAHNTMTLAGFNKPRIGVAALNPHAGEDGLYGSEEIEIITPAVKSAQDEGINVMGPFSADTIFLNAIRGFYDGITTMYHDQGQIALKVMNFEHAVTVLAGFSCPITTPAHGTAFDIVGKGIANPSAMEQAVKIASKMAG